VSPPATTVGVSIESELQQLFELFVEPKAQESVTYRAETHSRHGVASTRR
jgi:hypothetical protein